MCVRKKIGAPAFEAGGSLLLTLSTSKIFSGSEDQRGVRPAMRRRRVFFTDDQNRERPPTHGAARSFSHCRPPKTFSGGEDQRGVRPAMRRRRAFFNLEPRRRRAGLGDALPR